MTRPLEWLVSDLARLRGCASAVDALVAARVCHIDLMADAIHYLKIDMPRQFADLEIDILPLVTLRARRGDDLEAMVARLAGGHEIMSALVRQTLPRLEALKLVEEPVATDPWLSETLTTIAARHRSNLAMVGAVILPIARLRLRPRDLKALGQDLAARRNLTAPGF